MAAESSKKSTSLVIDYREGHNQSHLLQNLKTAFDKQLHTDFTLITSADDQKIRCHKLVLIMCSKFFEQLFTVRNYNEPQLTLPFVKGPMLKSLIYFMYHQQLKVDADGLHLTMDWASILWVRIKNNIFTYGDCLFLIEFVTNNFYLPFFSIIK